jgi:hypothetical protein
MLCRSSAHKRSRMNWSEGGRIIFVEDLIEIG